MAPAVRPTIFRVAFRVAFTQDDTMFAPARTPVSDASSREPSRLDPAREPALTRAVHAFVAAVDTHAPFAAGALLPPAAPRASSGAPAHAWWVAHDGQTAADDGVPLFRQVRLLRCEESTLHHAWGLAIAVHVDGHWWLTPQGTVVARDATGDLAGPVAPSADALWRLLTDVVMLASTRSTTDGMDIPPAVCTRLQLSVEGLDRHNTPVLPPGETAGSRADR